MKKETQKETIKQSYQHSLEAFRACRTRTLRNYRYVMNESWSENALKEARKHKKPTLRYNILIQTLNTLKGNEQLSRRRAYFKAIDDNYELADIIQGRWNALNDEQDIEETLQTAFIDALIAETGGYIERSFRMTKDGYLDFHYELANNLHIHLDPETKAHDFTLKSCGWLIKEGWESFDVLKLKYNVPGLKEDYKLQWWEELRNFIKEKTGEESTPAYNKENDKYQVLELQKRVIQKIFKVYDTINEQYHNIPVEEWYKKHRDTPGLQRLGDIDSSRIHQAIYVPHLDLIVRDRPVSTPSGNFDVFPCFSYPFSTKVPESTSLVSLLKDPQDDVNKGRSQVRDYMSKIIGGLYVVYGKEDKVVQTLQEKGNQPSTVVNPRKTNSRIDRLGPDQMNPQIYETAESGVTYSQRISMVDEALTGGEGKSGESAALRQKKIQMAAGAINPYFKNLANLRKSLARDFVDNFAFVYAENDRILNIKPQPGKPYEQVMININMAGKMLNNVQNPSMMVELDEGEDNITAKEDNFEKIMALNNIIMQINPAYVDIITTIDSAPIKHKDKYIQHITQQLQQASTDQAKQQTLAETKEQLENMKIEKGMILDEAKLRLEAQKTNQNKQEKKQ